jgi:hypothetical protein
VALQDAAERVEDARHLRVLEIARRVPGCVARREQQLVALPQRHVELVGEMDQHGRAGPRPVPYGMTSITHEVMAAVLGAARKFLCGSYAVHTLARDRVSHGNRQRR